MKSCNIAAYPIAKARGLRGGFCHAKIGSNVSVGHSLLVHLPYFHELLTCDQTSITRIPMSSIIFRFCWYSFVR